jgi:heptaprenyl diphosphate synthase
MFAGCNREEIETLTEFGEKIGIAFQLADDIIDIASDSLDSGKTPGTDLREGIPTLVTLNAMKSNDPKNASLKLALLVQLSQKRKFSGLFKNFVTTKRWQNLVPSFK